MTMQAYTVAHPVADMEAPIDKLRLRQLEGVRLDEPHEAVSEQVVLSSKGRPWRGISVWHQCGPVQDLYIAPTSKHSILIRRSSPATLLQWRGGEQMQRCWQPGEAVIVPAGMASFWRNSAGRDNLHVDLDPIWIKRVAGDERDGDEPILKNCFGSHDPVLFHLCQTLLDSLGSNASMHPLFADGIATALAIHLLEHHSDAARPASSGLSRRQLTLVEEHIEAHLAEPLHLALLAALTGLSPWHFSRCFKTSTGQTPHQYVIRLRMEHARQLIVTTLLPMLSIALETGFSSAAHFSQSFRKYWKTSPAMLRRSL